MWRGSYPRLITHKIDGGMTNQTIYLGDDLLRACTKDVDGQYVERDGETYYRIGNIDAMNDFFISVVSNSNHWLFISTRGGLTAGRTDCDSALFPYYTEDKIRDNSHNTGSRTLLIVEHKGRRTFWQPFAPRHRTVYNVESNLYKNVLGDTLVFEEINHDLGLTFSYSWSTSDKFGFVKRSSLRNDNSDKIWVDVLDGIENLLPYGIQAGTQNELSCLVDAYKKNELVEGVGLGIYAMSSILSDRAEPSEALSATTAWSYGLDNPTYLLSSDQVEDFSQGLTVQQETEVLGRRGAYLVSDRLELAAGLSRDWGIVADVNQSPAQVRDTVHLLGSDQAIEAAVLADIRAGTEHLAQLISTADGLQVSEDTLSANHHASNVLFNIMRGGLFDSNYSISSEDLYDFCRSWNWDVTSRNRAFFEALPDELSQHELLDHLSGVSDLQLERLCMEYLPLTFSRRHGDPSRPWNRFAIKVKDDHGDKILNYEGNWRDIFQNWEALSTSIPCFTQNMIAKFVNASTADGYNPYRITRQGIDWEKPEPENPWANIGYWGDHQLIYLLKLIELSLDHNPEAIGKLLHKDVFAYANVPYRIKGYADVLKNPYDTIEFDFALDEEIEARVARMGADGRLMLSADGSVYQVSLLEKVLVALLAKVGNFIPDTGIWMNTQRPEWNDANNALVGNGVSVVTLCYLHRFLNRFTALLSTFEDESVQLSVEVHTLFESLKAVFEQHAEDITAGPVSDTIRKSVMDGLGQSSEAYRTGIYQSGFSGNKAEVSVARLLDFLTLTKAACATSIAANRRDDGLYHAYNRIHVRENGTAIQYLYEMLEGQVAVLSAELLEAEESVSLLATLRQSDLYTARQNSYLLYPNRKLPSFMDRNCIPDSFAQSSALFAGLQAQENTDLIETDGQGGVYFAGDFNNTDSVRAALDELAAAGWGELVAQEREGIEDLFYQLFDCDSFTGRSGAMYAYEGLGSIYWHMVSKLLLAVMETTRRAHEDGCDADIISRLQAAYFGVREGIGFNKRPEVYGAFPTDPYSHTPAYTGARQPGMTGQVKEEVLTRLAELSVRVQNGQVRFDPILLRESEFLNAPTTLEYFDVTGQHQSIALASGQLGFTYCQVPIVLNASSEACVVINRTDGSESRADGLELSPEDSLSLFKKVGEISSIVVSLAPNLP